MLDKKTIKQKQDWAFQEFKNAGIILSEEERNQIEVSDFGLSNLEKIGIQLLVYVNTDRVCAKEIVMTAFQVCPEHKHVSVSGNPGKEETFRCRKGTVFLYVEGDPTPSPQANPPDKDQNIYAGCYIIPKEDLPTFYSLYYDSVFNKNRKEYNCTIVSTLDFCTSLKDILKSDLNINCSIIK